MTRFSDSFWNAEHCNFTGFEILCKRLKDGKQVTKDFADFLKLRAQAQEAYGKALIKLAKSAGGKDEIGTLRQAWEVLRNQTESIGLAHIATATSLLEEMNKVIEFNEQQRERKRKLEENVRKHQTNIKTLYKKAQESKRNYEVKCREADQALEAFSIESSKPNIMAKDLERVKLKQTKATQAADQADNMYRSAVENLEQGRNTWEHETETTCDAFQTLEEDRIHYLRNSMWMVTNLSSANCVNEDDLNEEIRKVLEKCDVETDIQLFIHQRHTGSERPVSIEYEHYTGGQTYERNGNHPGMVRLAKGLHLDFQSRNIRPTAKFMVPNPQSSKQDVVVMENDIYEEIGKESPKRNEYKILYDFEGRNDEELSLRADEIVFLLHKENDDWWEVETKNGTKGYFPATYMEPI